MIPVFPNPMVGRVNLSGAVTTGDIVPSGDMDAGSDLLVPSGDMDDGGDNFLWQETT